MKEVQEFLDEFFEEFQFRVNRLGSESTISKEMLYLLVENLILKYENKLQQPKQGILQKIFPFFSSSTTYDEEFEKEINQALEKLNHRNLISQNGMTNNSSSNDFDSKLNHEFSQMKDNIVTKSTNSPNLPANVSPSEKKQIAYGSLIQGSKSDNNGFSKTNIPENIEIALELDLLEGKEQDHADYFVLSNGASGIIIADGVSGDGKNSAHMAQHLPKFITKALEAEFSSGFDLQEWKEFLIETLQEAIESFEYVTGASTLIIALIEPSNNQLYTAWLGDGNMIYFNENYTGFSKLLTPHQDHGGQLLRAVTAEGLLGEPSVQIMSAPAGAIIITSDGYHLANGGILRHFFQKVLKNQDLIQGLAQWVKFCCDNSKYHPPQSDDRSIAVLRWKPPQQMEDQS